MRAHVLSTNPGFNPHPNPRVGLRGHRISTPPNNPFARQIEDQRNALEARERVGVSKESQWEKLQRLLCGPAIVLTTVNEHSSHLMVSMQLSERFGNDYKPRDGIKLVLRGDEAHFPLKVNWGMVFVSSPSDECPDPRSTFYMQADLSTSLFEAISGYKSEQLKVLIGFRDKRGVLELDVRSFGPAPNLF